jgi:hypothetical protein
VPLRMAGTVARLVCPIGYQHANQWITADFGRSLAFAEHMIDTLQVNRDGAYPPPGDNWIS